MSEMDKGKIKNKHLKVYTGMLVILTIVTAYAIFEMYNYIKHGSVREPELIYMICVGEISFSVASLVLEALSSKLFKYKKAKNKQLLIIYGMVGSIILISFITILSSNSLIVLGAILVIYFAMIIHFVAYLKILKRYKKEVDCIEGAAGEIDSSGIVEMLQAMFSIDFIFAKLFKNSFTCIHLKDDSGRTKKKKMKAELLKENNKINLIFTAVITIILFIYYYSNSFSNVGNRIEKLLLVILCFRFLSRAVEIILAFGIDCIEKRKSSSLSNGERFKLVIFSFLEIILLCSCVYQVSDIKDNFSGNIVRSIGISTMTDIDITSYLEKISDKKEQFRFYEDVKLFNEVSSDIKFINIEGLEDMIQFDIRLIIIIQSFTSLVLIGMALGNYMSDKKSNRFIEEEYSEEAELIIELQEAREFHMRMIYPNNGCYNINKYIDIFEDNEHELSEYEKKELRETILKIDGHKPKSKKKQIEKLEIEIKKPKEKFKHCLIDKTKKWATNVIAVVIAVICSCYSLFNYLEKSSEYSGRLHYSRKAIVSKLNSKYSELIEVIDNGKSIKLKDIYFETGSSDIDAEGKKTIDKFIPGYVAILDSYKIEQEDTPNFTITGHADYRGDTLDNFELSQDRALSVLKQINMNNGEDVINFSILVGKGENESIDDKKEYEADSCDMRKNRKVEVVIEFK